MHVTRYARAKSYDTGSLSTDDEKQKRAILSRHTEICLKLEQVPGIARHITSGPSDEGDAWWVLDEWVEGRTLSSLLPDVQMRHHLPDVMKQLAETLSELHCEGIVCRLLTPDGIVFREPHQIPVIVDFELGKLLQGAPTVNPNGKWPKPPAYIAPEICMNQTPSASADWYSWGMIFVHYLAGCLPERKGQQEAIVNSSPLPKKLQAVVQACIKLDSNSRPSNSAVMSALNEWSD